MIFRHEAPNCYLLLPAQGKDQGAYFMSTCRKCDECKADGSCFGKVTDDGLQTYDREVQELECIILAMNGQKMLDEYRGRS